MRFTSTLLGLCAAAATAFAQGNGGTLTIINQCPEVVYLVASNPTFTTATLSLSTAQSISINLKGLGSSVGFSTDPAFYSEAAAKLILGYSVNTDNGLIYYSVAADYGNPFASQSFSLTSPVAACTSVNSANGVTYACPYGASLTFTAC